MFRTFIGVGTEVLLRRNISGKGLGARRVKKITKSEVEFTLPDGRSSFASLVGVTVNPYPGGVEVIDSNGRIIADYNHHLEPLQ